MTRLLIPAFTEEGLLYPAARFGMPAFIKMDIEGGEREFLESVAFQDWIQDNRITLLVEMHHGYTLAAGAFPAMARQQVDHDHLVLEPLGPLPTRHPSPIREVKEPGVHVSPE